MVHFVANNPKLAPGASRNKIGHATRKRLKLVAGGNGANGPVAIVDATEDAEILAAPGCKVFATAVIRIGSDFFGENDPPAAAGLGHVRFTARVVKTKDIGRVKEGTGHCVLLRIHLVKGHCQGRKR